MDKLLILIFFTLILAAPTKAQDNYVPGEITLLNGTIQIGEVNDLFWRLTPEYIKFKGFDNKVQQLYPKDIKGFKIGRKSIYESHIINYDSSINITEYLTHIETPTYKRKNLFLRKAVSGPVTLFEYNKAYQNHFFLKSPDTLVELVDHHYYRIQKNGIRYHMKNSIYKSQLLSEFKDCLDPVIIDSLAYEEEPFIQFFLKYSSCNSNSNTPVVAYTTDRKDNFVPGQVLLKSGETLTGLVDDQFWKLDQTSIRFMNETNDILTFYPTDADEVKIRSKTVYKGRLVSYDSSSKKSEQITSTRNPTYKIESVFLKLLVSGKYSLLGLRKNEQDHFFIEYQNKTEELTDHFFRLQNSNSIYETKFYIEKLRLLLGDCKNLNIPAKLPYTKKALKEVFVKYLECIDEDILLFE